MRFFRSKPADLSRLLAEGAWDEALERIEDELRARPDSFEMKRARAETLLQAGRRSEAIPAFRALVDDQTEQGFYARALALIALLRRVDPSAAGLIAQLSERIAARQRLASRPAAGVAGPLPGARAASPSAAGTPSHRGARTAVVSPASPGDARSASGAFFMAFPPSVLPDLLALTDVRSFPKGSTVIREGGTGRSLFLIEEGTAEVRIGPAPGQGAAPLRLAQLRPGEFFGEVAALADRPRTATVVALEDLLVLELTRGNLDRLEAKHPAVRAVLERVRGERAHATIAALRAKI